MSLRQFFQQYGQTIIIVIALSASGIGWVFKKLAEQAAIRRAQMQREQRTEEMLRTGQGLSGSNASSASGPPTSPAEARERLAEIARRRQAQVEAARRQGRQQRTSQPERPTGAPQPQRPSQQQPIIIMGPNGPITIPRPPNRAPQGRPGSPRSQMTVPPFASGPPVEAQRAQPKPQQSQQQRQPKPQQKQRQQQQQRPASIPQRRPDPVIAAFVAPTEPSQGRSAVIRLPPASPRTAREFRRAIAMMEVLAPPLALRESEADGPMATRI